MSKDWYCYETGKQIDEKLPPVGVKCQAFHKEHGVFLDVEILKHRLSDSGFLVAACMNDHFRLFWSDDFRPLDHATHKVEAEKKQFVDYVTNLLYTHCCATKGELRGGAIEMYKLGFRLPESKHGNT